MNSKSGEQLKIAAKTGNIELLYAAIQNDPSILENIDKNQFVDTPLHISASRGHLEFATEIMNLKPSFAMKLNMQGYSPLHLAMDNSLIHLAMDDCPIHLAMDNGQREMVSNLVGINKDLVRVKGREGLTPLHFACQKGEVDLLTEFLTACPDSIQDVTVRGESALHIAVINQQFEALQALVGWLEKNILRGAYRLEEKILNQKDKAGNTVLHISALMTDPKFVEFLVKTGIRRNAKNFFNETALDLAKTMEIKKLLINANEKLASEVSNATTFGSELRSKITIAHNPMIWMCRIRSDITEEQRNTWLVVATLIATATFGSALTPPSGLFQATASDDNNVKITFKDYLYHLRGNAGKSILASWGFLVFSLANMLSFYGSIMVIVILNQTGPVGGLLIGPMFGFVSCHLIALHAISPTNVTTIILYIPAYLILFMAFIFLFFTAYLEYNRVKKLRKSHLRLSTRVI